LCNPTIKTKSATQNQIGILMRTPEQKQRHNELERARRRRIAEQQGRDCKVGRPPLDAEERRKRANARRRAWSKTPTGRARTARKNKIRKERIIEGREVILKISLNLV
jgi:hypothetical protein